MVKFWGHAVETWLRPCATSWKVASSISDGVFGFFIDITLPVALWPGIDTVPNRNEYQDYFLGVKAAGARDDNLTTFMY
jgi:hypothetical protein